MSVSCAIHHLESFREWAKFGLAATMKQHVIETETKRWSFVGARLVKPEFTPLEASRGGFAYEAKIVVDIRMWDKVTNNVSLIDEVEIGSVPLIVEPDDEGSDGIGGYFITSTERVLITQIRKAYNMPLVTIISDSKKGRVACDYMARYGTSELSNFTLVDTIGASLTIRSISEVSNHSCPTEIVYTKLGQILMSNSKYNKRLCVGLVLRALGCETMAHMMWATCQTQKVAEDLMFGAKECPTQLDALVHLANVLTFTQKTVENTKLAPNEVLKFLTMEIFPHLGLTATTSLVAMYLGHLVTKLYNNMRQGKSDDKDDLMYKRFEPAGQLIGDLFDQLVKKWIYTLTSHCLKKDDLIMGIQPVYLSKRIMYCFATGKWGAVFNFKRHGVSQPRNCQSYMAQVSHLQRVSSPISKETRNQQVRQFHPSHIGYICPCESPEGHTVGIVLNMCLYTAISRKIPSVILVDMLDKCLVPLVVGARIIEHLLFVNGRLVAGVVDVQGLFEAVDKIRRVDHGYASQISIGMMDNHVYLWCDEGRIVKPVWVGPRQGDLKDFTLEAFRQGLVRWIDPFEIRFCARNKDWTPLFPAQIFGVAASLIPLINHEPVPRGVYATNMNKQAICSLGPKQVDRLGATLNIGRVQHVPFVITRAAKLLGTDKYPSGNNIIVAICPYMGFNQEDAIVLNRASVERGLFGADSFKTSYIEEGVEGNIVKTIELVPYSIRNNMYNYCMLDEDGVIKVGSEVVPDDVLCGMVSFNLVTKKESEDCSVVAQQSGTVTQVVKSNVGGYKNVKVTIAHELTINVGDKFCSQYAQKGVCGKIVNHWELPYAEDGTVPDLLMTPLALPSRMTVPTILELLLGHSAIIRQERFELETFGPTPDAIHLLEQSLASLSEAERWTNKYGEVSMRNHVDGNLMAPIAMGPMYYNRLAHLAQPKCYARSEGENSKQTRQPTDGRSRQGGLRVGEMERDALIHMPQVLQDRLFHCSDAFKVYTCRACKKFALNDTMCLCGSNKIKTVNLSFTSNLIMAQFRALGCSILVDKDAPVKRSISLESISSDDSDSSTSLESEAGDASEAHESQSEESQSEGEY